MRTVPEATCPLCFRSVFAAACIALAIEMPPSIAKGRSYRSCRGFMIGEASESIAHSIAIT